MKRVVFLDYIRVVACFLVILVHASENFYGAPGSTDMAGPMSFLANETDRLWVSLYDGLSRIAVPLFMIVSAYLLVPMREGQSTADFYRRRAWRILPAFLFFMVVYSTVPMLWGQIDADTSVRDLSRIPLNFPTLAGHLWFMYPLFGLYLFIPMISPWLAKASAREERWFIYLFALTTTMPYLNRFFGELWGECFWNQFHMFWYFSGYLGYLVVAHYIRVHLDWSARKRMAVGVPLFVIGSVWTVLSFYVQAEPGMLHDTPTLEIGWSFCTINCLMATVGAFLLFSCIKKERCPKFVAELSNLSYGMYLMHILWLGFWVKVFKDSYGMPSFEAIPVIAVVTFASCAVTCKVLSVIPGLGWIAGVGSRPKQKAALTTE